MPKEIPEDYRNLLMDNRVFAHLGTIMPDGGPQVNPVWFDTEGLYIRVNSAKGRQKDKNMRRNPKVAIELLDPDNPYRYLQIRGRVIEITEEGADAHIDALTKKYLGQDRYPFRQPGEVRVIYKIEPLRVSTWG